MKKIYILLALTLPLSCGSNAAQIADDIVTWAEFGKRVIDQAFDAIEQVKDRLEHLKNTHAPEELASSSFSDPELTRLTLALANSIKAYNELVEMYNSTNPETKLELLKE